MKWIRDRLVLYLRTTDKLLWASCLAMSAIGCILLWAILQCGYNQLLSITPRNLTVQIGAVGLGAAAAFVLSNIDYNTLKKIWVIHVPFTYILVLLTFFIGVGAVGRPEDKRWLVLPIIDVWLQPAELLKISFILVFAYHIVKLGDRLNHPLNIALLCLHAGIPVLLIHFQGDDGTALLIAMIAVSMLFMGGIQWRYILGLVGAGAVMAPIAWHYILDNFQKQRILTLFSRDGEADVLGWYYQQFQAKVAIAMGGETGIGLLSETHRYIPEMHTDFIFAFLCESFGFMGALGVIGIMVFLSFKLLYNSRYTDGYGSLICTGVFAMILFQFVVNVGMCLSLIPVIGNPFPFLSYGGTSMVTNFLGIGLAQSVYMYRKRGIFSEFDASSPKNQ